MKRRHRSIGAVLVLATLASIGSLADVFPGSDSTTGVSQTQSSSNVARSRGTRVRVRLADMRVFGGIQSVMSNAPLEVAEDELIVTLSPDASDDDVRERLHKALAPKSIERLGQDSAFRVLLAEASSLEDAAAKARSVHGVDQASPNAIVRGTSNKREKAVLWNLQASNLPKKSKLDQKDITIAVLDSGLAMRNYTDDSGTDHGAAPWLDDVRVEEGYDFVDHDDYPDDGHSHGTHIASILVSGIGVAEGARLMPVRVLDDELVGTEAGLVAGIDYAVENGADVINLSLTFGKGYYPTRLLDRAIARALQAGVVVVAAAGNGGEENVRFPAAFPGVIAVGASTLKDKKNLEPASYSNYGAAIDILAPGGDLSKDVNGDGLADGIPGITFDPAHPSAFGAWLFSGTSQATAHVSGAVAHMLADGHHPFDIAPELRKGGDAPVGGFNAKEGGGYLDIAKAVRKDKTFTRPGVQLTAKIEGAAGAKTMRVGIAAIDTEGKPLKKHEVLGFFRGAASGTASCTTNKEGVCYIIRQLSGDLAAASFEVSTVVAPNGKAMEPDDVFAIEHEVQPVVETLGEGETGALLWRLEQENGTSTYLMRGLATDTALAPTIVALDDNAFAWATSDDGTGGTGFGSSSIGVFVLRYFEFYFTAMTIGNGFGSSSTPYRYNYYYGPNYYQYNNYAEYEQQHYGASLARVQYVPGEVVGASVFASSSVGQSTGATTETRERISNE